MWFKSWYKEVESTAATAKDKQAHWQQFMPRQSYKDLLVLLRGTIGLHGYLNINFPHFKIVPKTFCQDDVENYFSLVREHSPTAQRFFEIRKTLDNDFTTTNELGLLEGSSSSYEGPALPLMKKGLLTLKSQMGNDRDSSFMGKHDWTGRSQTFNSLPNLNHLFTTLACALI